MPLFVTFLHVILCLALILIILLQPGKDSASVFGGGAGNQMYGPRGQANLLGRATTAVAALFMVTSITLALYSSESVQQGSNIEEEILRLEREGGFSSKAEEPTPAPEPMEIEVPTESSAAPELESGAPAEATEGEAVPAPSEGETAPE